MGPKVKRCLHDMLFKVHSLTQDVMSKNLRALPSKLIKVLFGSTNVVFMALLL